MRGPASPPATVGYRSACRVRCVLRLSTDDRFGMVSGAAGNPAILAYANRALPSDRVDVAYATIFPSMTILKIVCVQVAMGVLGGHTSPGL